MKESPVILHFKFCMYDHRKPCVDCKLYSTNLDSIRKLAQGKYFKSCFSRLVGENPTPRQLSELLFHYDDKNPVFITETFGRTHIPSPLLSLGYDMAKERRNYVIRRFEIFNSEDFAFGVRCPNCRKEEPASPTAQEEKLGD
jgi:hypothetical protein